MVFNASVLNGSDYRLKRSTHNEWICYEWDHGIVEDTLHLVMQCPMPKDDINLMFNELREVDDIHVSSVLEDTRDLYKVIVGKHPEGIPFESMINIWTISCKYIASMFKRRLWKR